MVDVDLLTSLPGFRDYFPQDFQKIKFVLQKMRDVSIKYGYEEYEGPSVEKVALIEAKSGEGIMEEVFKFTDRDDRRLLLRPEQTPTLARMLAKEQQRYKRPLRWFSIPRIFRDETVQKGRTREFWQLNVDILGEESVSADAETIAVGIDIIRACGLEDNQFNVYINHRELLNSYLTEITDIDPQEIIPVIDKKMTFVQEYVEEYLSDNGLDQSEARENAMLYRRIINATGDFKEELISLAPQAIISLINDYDEIADKAMLEELKEVGLDEKEAEQLYELISISGSPTEFLDRIRQLDLPKSCHDSIEELDKLAKYLIAFDVADPVIYDASMARGLDYYTGIVYEAFDSTGQVVRAIFGGGRYDDLVEDLGGTELSGVGFGMGETVILELLKIKNAIPEDIGQSPDIYLAPIKEEPIPKVIELSTKLRDQFEVVCNPFDWRLGRHFEYADNLGAELVLLLGPRDIENNVISIRFMESGDTTEIDMDTDLIEELNKLLS